MSVVWFNGSFVEQIELDPAERGLMLGDGIFETLLVKASKPIWLEAHLARMAAAALELGLRFNGADIRFALAATLKRSVHPFEVLRITLTRGPTPRGLAVNGDRPSLLVSLNAFDRTKQPQHLRLATSSIRRNPTAPSSRLKTISYIDAIAAAREVAGRADEALMLNAEGLVASGTVGNVFVLTGQELITPSDDQGILKGIARAQLIAGADRLGLHMQERAIKPEEVFEAEAVFLTNSLRLATPVSSLDGKTAGNRDITFINDFLERNFT